MLRTEAASNNVNDCGLNKSMENLPLLRNALEAINDNYLTYNKTLGFRRYSGPRSFVLKMETNDLPIAVMTIPSIRSRTRDFSCR